MNNDLGHTSIPGTSNNSLHKGDFGCSLSHIQSCNTSDFSPLNFVYQRRRPLNNTSLSQACVSAKPYPDSISFVYERRKRQRSSVTNFFSVVSANTSASGACSSSIRPKNPMATSMEKLRGVHEADTARFSSLSAVVGNKEMRFTTSDANDGCQFVNLGSISKDKKNKIVELYSVDDSCSSSILNTDGGIVPSITEIDDTDECSSSGAHVTDVVRDDLSLSVKTLCVSILQSHNLLNRRGPSVEDDPSCSKSSPSRSCHVCGLIETAEEMLICDECEKAFHLSCFNPSIKKIPIDDWYCQSCAKKQHNLMNERAVTKSSIIRSGKGYTTSVGHSSPIELMLKDTQPCITGVRVGKGFQAIVPEWNGPMTNVTPSSPIELMKERTVTKSSIIRSGKGYTTSVGHSSPIELMLKDTQPCITGVRVGKGFQAIVPEWNGPMTKGLDLIPEPKELDPSFGVNLPRLVPGKPRKSIFIGNWLQCRDVIIGMGDDADGTICGKWRRAPLFEVQTDKWDCFRSVLWDPTYADCAVPQELETEEVLKQLKYIEMLRPRLIAKRRKLELCSVNGANGT